MLLPATPASSPIPFAQASGEPAFPMLGLVFLIGLALVSVLVIALARARSGHGLNLGRVLPGAAPRATDDAARLVSTTRLDGMTKLHVVAWGQRQYLIASAVNNAPVVLASSEPGRWSAERPGTQATAEVQDA